MAIRKKAILNKGGVLRVLVLVCALSLAPPSSATGAVSSDGNEYCNPRAPSGGALDFGAILKPDVCPVKEAGEMKCDPAKYANYPKERKTCLEVCKVAVDKWRKELPEVAAAAAKEDSEISAKGLEAGAGSTTGVNAGLRAFRGHQQNTATRGKAHMERGDNASKAKTKFDECVAEVNQACNQNLHPLDIKVAKAVVKACEGAASGAKKFAAEKKQDGAGMGDVSKLMDAAAKAMGMAQQAQGQPETPAEYPQSAATSPTPTTTPIPETQVAKLSGNSTAAPSVGFGSLPGQQVATAGGVGNTGSGLSGASYSNDAYDSAGSSADLGAGGGGEVAAAGGSSDGGGGGGSSSGSSRAPASEVLASLDTSGAFEMSPGGGKAFGGLKASKADLDAVADGSVLGGAGEELGGAPAEGEENAAGEEPSIDESESIFARVRSKYGLLKGSGRI